MAFVDTIIAALFSIFVVVNSRATTEPPRSVCFTFPGNSYLMYSPGAPYNNGNSAHFQLKFKSGTQNGLLMYARGNGSTSDFEAMYLRGGYLHYQLFNSGLGGVGRQFGGHYVSDDVLDSSSWYKVDVFRSLEIARRTRHSPGPEWKTGFELSSLNGDYTSTQVDNFQRRNIDISNNIYFGGFEHRLSETIGNFTGQMKEIQDITNSYTFGYPTVNFKSLVDIYNCFRQTNQ